MTIRALARFVLVLGAVALPASATVQYSYCTSGCDSTTGNYSAWQTGPGSAGLTFSMSPITFSAGGLSGGVYTDGTGTVFTGYNGVPTSALILSGSSLVNTVSGTGAGIELMLPANTYAVALMINQSGGSFGFYNVAINDHNLSGSNYSMTIIGTSSPQFFGIASDAALTSIFIGAPGGTSGAVKLESFELGTGGTATPEASTLALIGSGLLALGMLRRRRVHKPDSPPA